MMLPDQQSGAWIFLSHSNKDFEKVREIRNLLEKRGHKPIMFFLKCLENDDAQLPELLKQEIAARQIFIFCDSPNAQVSKWVQEEVAMIQKMEGNVFKKVDLSKRLETEIIKLVELSKRATVYLSYAYQDKEIAERVQRVLLQNDYRVWIDVISVGNSEGDFVSVIQSAIDDAIERGFVLLMLSEASLKSQFCRQEALYALEKAASQRSNVVPVVVSNLRAIMESLPPSLEFRLSRLQWYDLSNGPLEANITELIKNLKTREME